MGCGSSIPVLSSIKPNGNNTNRSSNIRTVKDTSNNKSNRLSPINSRQKLSIGKQKRVENLEAFTLICLDEHFNDNDKQLRPIIDYIYYFDDINECEEFISNVNKNHFIFFIVSSQHVTQIVSHVHDLLQLVGIYVFQSNRKDNYRRENDENYWMKRYVKVKIKLYLSLEINR